jgi:hypothetical protein
MLLESYLHTGIDLEALIEVRIRTGMSLCKPPYRKQYFGSLTELAESIVD